MNIPNLPNHIQINQTKGEMVIKKKWFVNSTLTLFSIGWTSLTLFFIIGTILNIPNEIPPPSAVLVLSVFLLVAILVNNITIPAWFNRTYIFANNKKIYVYYKPIPCFGLSNKKLRAANLKSLYLKKFTPIMQPRDGQKFNYVIHANTNAGRDKKLVVVNTQDEAFFIKKKLESFYNLQDEL